MTRQPQTVYILDDEAGMRKALARLLSAEGYDPRPCSSAADFLAEFDASRPACLILDIAMPDVDGLEFQSRLKRLSISIPIIFLTGHGSIPMSVRGIKEGAVEFLTKPVRDDTLLAAVSTALKQASKDHAKGSITIELKSRHDTLTPRQKEVMEHVVGGKANKQIAAELATSEQNIKIHRGRVMKKMGADSLVDLVRAADRLKAPDV